jgi:iron complex transport system permease protein
MAHLRNAGSLTTTRSLPSAWLIGGAMALLLALLGLMLGPVALTPGQVFGALVSSNADPAATAIVRNVRLPRVLLAALAGGLLGVAALLLGPLAQRGVRDPGWSGVAALGALAGVVALVQAPTTPPWAISLATIAGCSLGVALLVLAQRRNPQRLRLGVWIGLASALITPALSFLLLIGEVRIATWVRWSIGSLEQRDWTTWQGAGPIALLALILVVLHAAWPQREYVRWAAASVATAAATLAAGALGTVGWVAGRWAVRSTKQIGGQFVGAAIFGAALLLGADLAARGLTTLLPSLGLVSELPVGALLIVVSLAVLGGRRWL